MRDIRVELSGEFTSAQAIHLDQKLTVTANDNKTSAFMLPRVGEYEVVVLE